MIFAQIPLTWTSQNRKVYGIELTRINTNFFFALIRVNSMQNPCFLYKQFTDKVLGKPQKVFKITNTQNCGFLQGKAGFAQFYFRKLFRFYLITSQRWTPIL